MPRRSLLSNEQRTRLFAVPVDHAEMAKHYVLSADDLVFVRTSGARSIGLGSLLSCASCGIPARAWELASFLRKR